MSVDEKLLVMVIDPSGLDNSTGYGFVTKYLHWTIFLLMAGQFLVGYAMERADDVGHVMGFSEDRLFAIHVNLGVSILLLASVRIVWRLSTKLPPWAPTLSPFERRYAHLVEMALYVLMLAIPLSGLLAAIANGEDLSFFGLIDVPEIVDDSDLEDLFVGFHVVSHLAFFVAFALHLGLVIKHQFLDHDRLLNRML